MLGVLSGLVALLALVPLLFVVVYTVSIGWDQAWALVVRPRVAELLSNTGRLVVGCMLLTAVIGTGAGLGGRADQPARPAGLEHPARGAAGRAGVRQQLGWVSLTSRVEGFGGRAASS